MKHTKENCNTCGVELTDTNWSLSWKNVNRTQCIKCSKNNNTNNNPNRMYVNGKYVPKSHPLYKAGRYKNFESAAFSSLEGYEKSNVGHVYIVSNPAWEGWYKVGMAVDADDRCRSYQTSSPMRDFKLEYFKFFDDRRNAENIVHLKLSTTDYEKRGEWFNAPLNEIVSVIKNIQEESNE